MSYARNTRITHLAKPVAPISYALNKRFAFLLMGGIAILAPSLAEGSAAESTPYGHADATEAVIITATRRPEPLQKVPVAVSVIDGDLASSQNLNNINAIATIVPSLNFRDGQSNKDQGLFIRGVGTVTTSPGAEPSVSTVVDGVVLVRPGQATLDLVDVDHIEVLRGPQGTLFGKNASAGVVNIVTKDPSAEFRASADVSYFERNEVRAKASLTGALVPGKVNALVSVLYGDFEGNVLNVARNDTVNGYSKVGTRSKLEYTPSETLRILVTADYLYSYSSATAVVAGTDITYPNAVVSHNAAFGALLAPVVTGSDNRTINTNQPTYVIDTNAGVAVQADWQFSGYTLTSVSAYRKWHNNQVSDNDFTAATAYFKQIADHGRLDFDQYSQELRVTSPKGERIEYVGGLYYLHAVDREIYQRRDTAAGGATVNTGVADYGTLNNNYAAFAEANLNVTDSFRLIAGGRLIADELSYDHTRTSTAADSGINPTSAYASAKTIKYGYAARFGVQYDIAPSISSYATYAHGYKGPAYNVFFNMVPATQGKVLNSETSDSFEIGLKSRLLDGALVINAAAFHTAFDNFQANFPNLVNGTVVTNLVNAGTVISQGVEADFAAKPTDRLTFSGGIAFINAFVDQTTVVGRNWAIAGQPLPFQPTWKLNLRADYHYPLTADYNLVIGTDGRWQSKVQYDLSESPDTIEGGFGIWNADIGLENENAGWGVTFLLKNVLNYHYNSYLQSSGATAAPGTAGYVTRWAPRDDSRYIGVNLHKTF